MSPRTVGSSRHAIETCILKLHTWRPFNLPTSINKPQEKPDPTITKTPKAPSHKPHKRPCYSDRGTTSFAIETIDMSNLSLFDDNESRSSVKSKRERMHWLARKRRRRGSRSVSGSDQRCCSVGGSNAYGTCSDFVMGNNGGTSSSGELFVNGGNWTSDASEAAGRSVRRESGDRENGNGNGNSNNNNGGGGSNSISGLQLHHHYGNLDSQGNESGYGSEPGYRGDVEFGYGDEFDEEEEDARVLFWGNKFGDARNTEIIGENTLQKAHHRCRRKKHELRMIDAV